MTQSPIPLIEANLAFSWKPGEVEVIRNQKAGGRENGRDPGVSGGLADSAGAGAVVGGLRHEPGGTPVATGAPQPRPVVRAMAMNHVLLFHRLGTRLLIHLFCLHYNKCLLTEVRRWYLFPLNLQVTNPTSFINWLHF